MNEHVVKASEESRLKALEFFKDWSNYLLVTTVVAMGWVATRDETLAVHEDLATLTVVFLGVSAIFGIFTLAMLPVIAEHLAGNQTSIYGVKLHPKLGPLSLCVRLKWACLPQHVLFILGIITFMIGSVAG